MSEARLSVNSGNIAVSIIPSDGGYVCELAPSFGAEAEPTQRAIGQSPSHAIAIALEKLARAYRMQAETEQNIDWETGPARRFHVILHYEWIGEEETKFNALENTLLGNTVVENAETTIIQVDANVPVECLKRDGKVVEQD